MNLPALAPNIGQGHSSAEQDVAVIGMACVFPGAKNIQNYWENILNKVNAVGDTPPEWESQFYLDPQAQANDRVYCARGGYLGKLAEFNPLDYGVMPSSVDGGEPDHFLALRVAQEALADAGYQKRDFPRERTEVIIGRGTYVNRGNTTVIQHGLMVDQFIRILQQLHPEHSSQELASIREKLKASLPPFHAETAPSLVPNIISGRISNRLDLMGPNFIVDAACASSLVATDLGMRDLLSGRCDLVIAGGVHASTPPPIVMIFCQLQAISRHGEIRPFDAKADGTLLGEGAGMVVLKRRADAERDGDRIYAVLKAVGTSSDGRAVGLLAPRLEGEELALRRAYEGAGISTETVGLVEAHGTATPVGDAVELEALGRVFGPRQGELPRCALGSVKSMIGHLMPASGIAGLIKTVMALYHKVLPPTINCNEPNPKLELGKSVFYINTETRPWIHGSSESPRRAAVNAFGFGGINAHAVLEEYVPLQGTQEPPSFFHQWESEVLLISGNSRDELVHETERIHQFLSSPELAPEDLSLKDLAFTLNVQTPLKSCRLAIVSSSLEDLQKKISRAAERLRDNRTKRIREVEGIYYFDTPLARRGQIAFVFPGEGSQYPNMLADLCIHFPSVRQVFDLMDRAFAGHPRGYLPSQVIFPLPLTRKENEESVAARLWEMDSGAEAVFTANQGLNALLEELQIQPTAVVGHSTGEHSALLASGVVRVANDQELIEHVRGVNAVFEALQRKSTIPEGVLVAVGGAKWELLESLVEESGGKLHVAMDNCPHQVVLCGTTEAMPGVIEKLQAKLAICQPLSFARPYHTPWFDVFCEDLRTYFEHVNIGASKVALYSCLTADRFPPEPEIIRGLVSMQWAGRVRFRETVERMYNDGVRIFVEVGPRGNLAGFIDDILKGREYTAIPSNVMHRSGITQLNHLVAQLAAHDVPMSLERLYERRLPQRIPIGPATDSDRKARRLPRSMPLHLGLQPLRLPAGFVLAQPDNVQARSGEEPAASAPTRIQAPMMSPGRVRDFSPETANVPFSPPSPPAMTAGGSRESSALMQEHLSTMDQFLKVQLHVMEDYLGKIARVAPGAGRVSPQDPPATFEVSSAARAATVHPFVGEVIKLIPGREAILTRRFEVAEKDILFQDHTLGRNVSTRDRALSGLPVVPLTISMEILAESAAVLQPGKVLVGMKNIRAYRWITLEEQETSIQISARSNPENPCEVAVAIRELRGEDGATGPALVEGTMVFAGEYPPVQRTGSFAIQQEGKSKWAPEQLYRDGMFHGPSFQVVKSMDRFGADGATATMATLPRQNLFRGQQNPEFQTEPVLLDGAGQVVAFWTKEKLGLGVDIFPYSLKALHLFSAPPDPGVRVECRVRPRLLNETQMTSDIDLVLPDGRLYARLEAWEDRCFILPANFLQLRISPIESQLSSPWDFPTIGLAARGEVSGCWLEGFPQEFLEAQSSIWLKALAHLVLGTREREVWRNLDGVFKRRREWLLGRCVAKDAVRLLLKRNLGVSLCPADVEILSDEFGAPLAEGWWKREFGVEPGISIAHSNEVAVALAAMNPNQLVGIDIELLGQQQDGFENLALTAQEREFLPEPNPGGQREWSLRLWCAKEAVAKAIRRGASNGPFASQVRGAEADTGLVTVELGEGLLNELPEFRERQFLARTGRQGDYVYSAVLLQDEGEKTR